MSNEFEVSFSVRNYECDQTGVVNNAVSQNYLEHARHEFLKSLSIDFADLARKNVALVVTKATLTYRSHLRSGDTFVVTTRMERLTPSKFQFIQNIYNAPDRKLILKGEIVGAALGENGPLPPDELIEIIPELKILER